MARQAEAPEASQKKNKRAQAGDNLKASNEALTSQLSEVFKLADELASQQLLTREASGRYRSAVKIAKKLGAHLGVEADHIARAVRLRSMEIEAIDRDTTVMNRVCVLANIPLQMSFFVDADGAPRSVATVIEEGGKPPMPGDEAFRVGMIPDDNPYPVGVKAHRVWNQQWLKAQHDAGKTAPVESEEAASVH